MSDKKGHSKLWLYFAGIVFLTVLAVFFFVAGIWFLLYKCGVLTVNPIARHFPIIPLSVGSLLIGISIALFVGKLIIVPIQNISNAFKELSKGNFSVRVSEDERIDEIREMSKRFNETAFDLSHIETLRNDFIVNVSHEFKTPLAAIEGYAMLMQNPTVTPEKREYYIEKILDNSKKLSELSSNILMLSKLENSSTLPQCGEYRLDEQIRKVILMSESKWSKKDIEFDLELPRTDYYGCEQLLTQVWSNIIDNAVKHAPVGSTVCVTLEKSESILSVCVADSGDGMSEEVQKHIFEKFYQGDSSRKEEGNGLGLALVKRILDLCGGEISVKSAVGEGAAFTVTLPVDET